MAKAPCTCRQCRVRLALFSGGRPTDNSDKSDAIWALTFVVGDLLAGFDEGSRDRVLRKISENRDEAVARHERVQAAAAAGDASADLSAMEVAGHG